VGSRRNGFALSCFKRFLARFRIVSDAIADATGNAILFRRLLLAGRRAER
jgi:hypothetical protein